MHIVVVGAGGAGGYFGGRLAQAGLDVTMVARGTTLEVIRASGLTIRSPLGDAVVPVGAVERADDVRGADLIIFATKTYQLETAARAMLPAITPGTLVLGCDSVLGFEGEILGKPADAAQAIKRWQAMRGRTGVLHTGHHLIDLAGTRHAEGVASTVVQFADISDEEVETYVATDEPLHVAGAFTIDGRGGAFVDRIEGDHGNVIGLSLPLLRRLLADLEVPITALWRS